MGKSKQDGQDHCLIEELVYRWAAARDGSDWDALSECFHPEATIHVSWIESTAEEFVARSREMTAKRSPGANMKHLMAGAWVVTNGNRGFSRANALLLIRDRINDTWVDIESHIRFFDRVERRDDQWKIVERVGIYDKDRIDLVDADSPVSVLPRSESLSAYPREARFLHWWLAAKGLAPVDNLVVAYSDAERNTREKCLAWMQECDTHSNSRASQK